MLVIYEKNPADSILFRLPEVPEAAPREETRQLNPGKPRKGYSFRRGLQKYADRTMSGYA